MNDLEQRAKLAHPHNVEHQRRWLAAVKRLRAGRGWVADQGATAYRMARTPEAVRDDPPPLAYKVHRVK
jgi:hypothetical protein